MRRLKVLLLCALLALGLAPFAPAGARPAAAEDYCFPETKYCAENAFLEYWRTHGSTDILGLPVSQPFVDDRGLIVQFYERAIMEWHPQNGPEFQVLLTRLGDTQLGGRPERNEAARPCDGNCAVLEQTGHTLRGTFLEYWQQYGGLAVFGFPLTEEFEEVNQADGKSYKVQYFERNRFEFHPEYTGSKYVVSLGLLGAESLKTQQAILSRPPTAVPNFSVVAATPVRLAIPAINAEGGVQPVGVDPDGSMTAPTTAFDTTWYAPGPRPGQRGNAVIAGHVDFRGVGPAIFWDVQKLAPGSEVWVTGDNGSRKRFLVQRVESYRVADAPINAIFGPTSEVNLNLISCVGNFDPVSRSYDRRIVVYTRWDGVSR